MQNPASRIAFKETVIACVVAMVFGVIAAVASNRKWLYLVARKFRITQKTGEADVWSDVMSQGDKTMFVTLRDGEADLVYDGWIQFYSENCEVTELFMRDVDVFRNSDATVMYSVSAMYFKLDPEKIILEFRGYPAGPAVGQNAPNPINANPSRGEVGGGNAQPEADAGINCEESTTHCQISFNDVEITIQSCAVTQNINNL